MDQSLYSIRKPCLYQSLIYSSPNFNHLTNSTVTPHYILIAGGTWLTERIGPFILPSPSLCPGKSHSLLLLKVLSFCWHLHHPPPPSQWLGDSLDFAWGHFCSSSSLSASLLPNAIINNLSGKFLEFVKNHQRNWEKGGRYCKSGGQKWSVGDSVWLNQEYYCLILGQYSFSANMFEVTYKCLQWKCWVTHFKIYLNTRCILNEMEIGRLYTWEILKFYKISLGLNREDLFFSPKVFCIINIWNFLLRES